MYPRASATVAIIYPRNWKHQCISYVAGSFTAATDVDTLKHRNITHILTLDICPLPTHITEKPFLTTKYVQGMNCILYISLETYEFKYHLHIPERVFTLSVFIHFVLMYNIMYGLFVFFFFKFSIRYTKGRFVGPLCRVFGIYWYSFDRREKRSGSLVGPC